MLEASLEECGKNISSKFKQCMNIFCNFGMLGLIMTQFYPIYYSIGQNHVYERKPAIFLFMLGGACLYITGLYMVVRFRRAMPRHDFNENVILLLIIVLAIILQFASTNISFINITNALVLIALFFRFEDNLATRMVDQERLQREMESALLKSKLELSETSSRIMLSQIGPHFIFNALTCIRALIRQNPDQAQKAVGYFAKYLRRDMQMLTQEDLIDIDQEIDFTNNFIYMEKMRFGDALQIHIEKEDIIFYLPVLTIQPLVDNAIEHGIRRKEGGEGTVIIRIFQEEKDYMIQVWDDGVGYDEDSTEASEHMHSGIRNIRSRLEIMCHGSLEISSEKGKYTLVTVRIPKEEV